MAENLKPFDIEVGERQLALRLGTVAVCLFRQSQEVDYFAVDLAEFETDETGTLRVFCNEDLCRYMAGFAIKETVSGRYIYEPIEFNGHTFHEEYGWSPATIIKDGPSDKEKEWFADVVANTLEDEWQHWEEEDA